MLVCTVISEVKNGYKNHQIKEKNSEVKRRLDRLLTCLGDGKVSQNQF